MLFGLLKNRDKRLELTYEASQLGWFLLWIKEKNPQIKINYKLKGVSITHTGGRDGRYIKEYLARKLPEYLDQFRQTSYFSADDCARLWDTIGNALHVDGNSVAIRKIFA